MINHSGDPSVINLTDSIAAGESSVPSDSLYPELPEGNASLNDTLLLNDSISTATKEAADTGKKTMAADSLVQSPQEEVAPKPSNWETGGQTAFNFSQISLSNWSAGGQNSVSFTSYLNLFARYKSPDKNMTWENTLDIGFGKMKQEDKESVKSDDKIDFSSKFGRRASETWFYSTLVSFRTQMAAGYKRDNYISNFLAPATINVSIGMDHKFDENINFYLSPLAGKVTLVMSDSLSNQGAYGVEPGEYIKYEFGGFVRAQFRATLMENITVTSKLEFFSNYVDKPLNLDVNSDTRINMQVNKFISANVLIQMMYDENTLTKAPDGTNLGPKLQLKQVFGLGFSYRF